MLENGKCRLCSDEYKTANPIINKCSKLAQKEYKNRYDWVGKVIHRELCKGLKFDHANKWNIHKLESVLKNEVYKILRDFEIQMDHPILFRRPNLVLINKKKRNCHLMDFAVPIDHRERKWKAGTC